MLRYPAILKMPIYLAPEPLPKPASQFCVLAALHEFEDKGLVDCPSSVEAL